MRKFNYSYPLSFIFMCLLTIGNTFAAGGASSKTLIKCWKNDLGIRECGSVVPPEYSQRRIEVVNERGLVVQVIEPPKTREELEQEREAERLRKEQEAAKKAQAHRDAVLLNSYATERDLLIARDVNLKAAQGQLDIAEGNLKVLQNTLAELQNRAGDFERSGKQAPPELVKKIEQTKKQITEKESTISKKQEAKTQMEKRFEQDLQHFRKLKGLEN